MRLHRRMLGLVVRRPWLLPEVVGAAWAFRRRNWYRTFPFLPLPSRLYLRWRMETAYGDPNAVPPYGELERYLRWARAMRREMRDVSRAGRGGTGLGRPDGAVP